MKPLPIDQLRSMSFLIHAAPKMGKTTLSATLPPPILVLDIEDGWEYIEGQISPNTGRPYRRIDWDPMIGPPPRHDGSWDFCVVAVTEWALIPQIYTWLTQAEHDFHSVVIDSITELQRRCRDTLDNAEALRIQDWGVLKAQVGSMIRSYRDLIKKPQNPIKYIIYICESAVIDGVQRPNLDGGIKESIGYMLSMCAVLLVEREILDDGTQGRGIRKLLLHPSAGFEVGSRVEHVVPPIMDDPNLTQLVTHITYQLDPTLHDTPSTNDDNESETLQ